MSRKVSKSTHNYCMWCRNHTNGTFRGEVYDYINRRHIEYAFCDEDHRKRYQQTLDNCEPGPEGLAIRIPKR